MTWFSLLPHRTRSRRIRMCRLRASSFPIMLCHPRHKSRRERLFDCTLLPYVQFLFRKLCMPKFADRCSVPACVSAESATASRVPTDGECPSLQFRWANLPHSTLPTPRSSKLLSNYIFCLSPFSNRSASVISHRYSPCHIPLLLH